MFNESSPLQTAPQRAPLVTEYPRPSPAALQCLEELDAQLPVAGSPPRRQATSVLDTLASMKTPAPVPAPAAAAPTGTASRTDPHPTRPLPPESRNIRPRTRTEWAPKAPASIADAGLSDTQIEGLVLKYLLSVSAATGREIADQVRLPFVLLEKVLRQLKNDQLVAYKGAAPANDYAYQLAPRGGERAAIHSEQCTYFGAAPVSMPEYVAGVAAQSVRNQHPNAAELRQAFADMQISPETFSQIGQAAYSGGAMFLHGAPGNGKTSIAERLTNAFGEYIWVPRAIGIEGEIVRLFDPAMHIEAPISEESLKSRDVDRRWIRIRRPTIITGGELMLEHLEMMPTGTRGVLEAPFQLKSCCGTLVVDDFGRQRISTRELLNRWIVPLEKGYDFLNLPNGKKVRVPFDQMVVFATNLEPRDLVDEAFMRRISYKIRVNDPTEQDFHQLFRATAPKQGIAYVEGVVTDLIERHYKSAQRPLRFCHVRDLLQQVCNYCAFHELPLEMRPEYFNAAIANYFGAL